MKPFERCLAHLSEASRNEYLARLTPGSDLDHRGTTLTDDLLERLGFGQINALTADRVRVGNARFDGATFTGDAMFAGVTFSGKASFAAATFSNKVRFDGAKFFSTAWFDGAKFSGEAEFDGVDFSGETYFDAADFRGNTKFRATFVNDARFRGVSFLESVTFVGAKFFSTAWFDQAMFQGSATFKKAAFASEADFSSAIFFCDAWFDDARFSGDGSFGHATFAGNAWFNGAGFSGDVWFGGTTILGDASFEGTTFEGSSGVGPLVCRQALNLSGAVFGSPVTIEAAAMAMNCVRTRWGATAALRLRYATVDLKDAIVDHPLSVSSQQTAFIVERSGPLDETALDETDPSVRIRSLSGIDAGHLVLTDVSLGECQFTGTVHLDQLRLEGRCTFAGTPTAIRRRGWRLTRWNTRHTIAEEHYWRALQGDGGWNPAPDGVGRLGPDALAPVYRQLRKSLEDGKNEPDAADFYYGEMEMRRHDHSRSFAERSLLTAYWAMSGYGLRASRAMGWLLVAGCDDRYCAGAHAVGPAIPHT